MISKDGAPTHPEIDTIEFARAGSGLSGSQRPADFPRLNDLLVDDCGALEWTLAGERHERPEGGADSFLRLRFSGSVRLRCVRCLEPVEVQVEDSRLFRVAATETQAAREDLGSEEFDVLAASKRFDVQELVEDEIIMALPIAPRHVHCSLPGDAADASDAGQESSQRPNPFAALRGLRRDRGAGGDDQDR